MEINKDEQRNLFLKIKGCTNMHTNMMSKVQERASERQSIYGKFAHILGSAIRGADALGNLS